MLCSTEEKCFFPLFKGKFEGFVLFFKLFVSSLEVLAESKIFWILVSNHFLEFIDATEYSEASSGF